MSGLQMKMDNVTILDCTGPGEQNYYVGPTNENGYSYDT